MEVVGAKGVEVRQIETRGLFNFSGEHTTRKLNSRTGVGGQALIGGSKTRSGPVNTLFAKKVGSHQPLLRSICYVRAMDMGSDRNRLSGGVC
jgi:hypothetical protein